MNTFELLGKALQLGITYSQRLQFLRRRKHIVPAGTRPAMALPCKMKLLVQVQSAGVLTVSTVDDVT